MKTDIEVKYDKCLSQLNIYKLGMYNENQRIQYCKCNVLKETRVPTLKRRFSRYTYDQRKRNSKLVFQNLIDPFR